MHNDLRYLNLAHELVLTRQVTRLSDLRNHLIFGHGISVQNAKTRGELGRLHLLAHAVISYPELSELLELPEGWGKS